MSKSREMFDTSVWIEFFRGIRSSRYELLNKALAENSLCICPPILQEVLQGIRDNGDYKKIRLILSAVHQLEMEPYLAASRAADLYRSLRKAGVTIRKPNDCLIAVYCLEANLPLIHNDSDFELIARHSKLLVYS